MFAAFRSMWQNTQRNDRKKERSKDPRAVPINGIRFRAVLQVGTR